MTMNRADRPDEVRYQAVCTQRKGEQESYVAYGLQCLGDFQGTWVQLDVIEDVLQSKDHVLQMADQFNALNLSPIHFRDAVMDRLNG